MNIELHSRRASRAAEHRDDATHFFLQLSNQSLHGPVTLGLPFDRQVEMHLFVHPHFLQSSVQGMQAFFWAVAGRAEQQSATTIALTTSKGRIKIPPDSVDNTRKDSPPGLGVIVRLG